MCFTIPVVYNKIFRLNYSLYGFVPANSEAQCAWDLEMRNAVCIWQRNMNCKVKEIQLVYVPGLQQSGLHVRAEETMEASSISEPEATCQKDAIWWSPSWCWLIIFLSNLSCEDPNPDGIGSLVPSVAWQWCGRLLGLACFKLLEHLGQLDARDGDEGERCQDRDDCQYLHL